MKPNTRPFSTRLIIPICLLIFGAGCSQDPVSPGTAPEIVNATDTFQFQVTEMQNFTGSLRYKWTTTGTVAEIDQSSVITDGVATLTVRDASDKQVFARAMNDDGSFPTLPGASGDWTIELAFAKATGTLNFRAQKNQ